MKELKQANDNLLNNCIMNLQETKDLSLKEVINMCIDNKVILHNIK